MAQGGYCMGDCLTSADCGTGGVCVGAQGAATGDCYDGCTADTDCREGYLCGPITSTCRPAPPTDQLADNTAGTACTMDGDCGDGVCQTMRGSGGGATPLPGGYCTGACLDDSHCGAGGVCRRTGAGAGACYGSCATDTDCTRDGYRCREIGGDLLGCLPAPDPLPDGVTGAACTTDAECGAVAGACASELPAAGGGSIATPGGYCTIECEVDVDCGAGAVCVQTRGGGWCFKTCTTATDCRTDYVCGERGGGDMPSIVCTPFEPDEDVDAG
jgi:Cys-rich repeat protein